MNSKLVFTVIALIATIGMATPAILDSAFAVKGGSNENSLKSCEKQLSKKCPTFPYPPCVGDGCGGNGGDESGDDPAIPIIPDKNNYSAIGNQGGGGEPLGNEISP